MRFLPPVLIAVLAFSQAAGARPRGSIQGSSAPFAEVERLAGEQKLQAALEKTLSILKGAGDSALQTEALIKATQLEMGLHGYETAVRFLKESEWPKDGAARVLLELYYAQALITYQQQYGWEIGQREKTVSSAKIDLKSWTTAKIGQEIGRSFDKAMTEGVWLEGPLPEYFRRYLQANSYPGEVRPTVRDALVYLAVQHLANQQYWSAQAANEVYRLPFARLASGELSSRLPAAGESAHPLERAASWLSDLARVHKAKGRGQAYLEARYVLFETLHNAASEEGDKKTVRDTLRSFQKSAKGQGPWWSRGQAVLARFFQSDEIPGSLIEAKAEAALGAAAFPGSPGSRMCASILQEIERPELNLMSMSSDSSEKRSLLLNYRNARKAYFRAIPINFEGRLKSAQQSGILSLSHQELLELLAKGQGKEISWSVDLPETADYRQHRKFVTPPAMKKGLYQIVSSLNPDFSESSNLVTVAPLINTDIIISLKRLAGGSLEARALAASSGKPKEGVMVSLYSYSYQTPPSVAASHETDANGYAVFSQPTNLPAGVYPNYFFVARQGDNLAVEQENIWFGNDSEPADVSSSFVYTDRSIYRPQQKVQFKVVAYAGRGIDGRFQTAKEGESIKVQLMDPNYQAVSTAVLRVNPFGSASGTFVIPSGRPLGSWQLQATGVYGGSTTVKVEEYKRPTFEPLFKEAEEPLRLNRKARLNGEAKYYFGLPVTSGSVHWRVTREEVAPWWWFHWGWFVPGNGRSPQTVASGTSELRKDGTFQVEFTPSADERKSQDGKSDGTSFNFRVEADITDEGGETRTATRTFRLGFVAVEAKLDWENGFFPEGKDSSVLAHLANLDGKPLKGTGKFQLFRLDGGATLLPSELPREQESGRAAFPVKKRKNRLNQRAGGRGLLDEFTSADDLLRARWETEFSWQAVTQSWKLSEELAQGSVDHDEKGEGRIALPPLKSGVYRIVYQTKDAFGAVFEATRDFLVAGAYSAVNLPLVVQPEQRSRKVGETARFLIHSGLGDQPLAVEVYRSGKRISRSFLVSGKSSDLLEIPVTKNDRGGFTVAVSGVRDHQVLHTETNVDVPWTDRELKVEFATFRDKLKPGGKETFTVSVKGGEKGEALEAGAAEVLAYMYDRSLDFFGDHTPPMVSSLYPPRTGAPRESFSLGVAPSWTLVSSLPPQLPFPTFMPDRLAVYPSYGIGGPGRRGGGYGIGARASMAKAEGMMMADSAAAAPSAAGMAQSNVAPMAEKEKKTQPGGPPREPVSPAGQPVELRSNFSETAFFAPHLLLGPGGTTAVEFTAPDSVTSWKVLAHAITRDLRGGSVTKESRTVKELMVRPYVPRFLREGDEAEIKVQVNNASDTKLEGELVFEIEDGQGKSALAEFGVKGELKKPFSVGKAGSVTLGFPIKAPRKVGDYAFKAVARTKNFSDGERRPFPMLPSRMHLAQSRFVALHNKDSKVLEFKDLAAGSDSSLINEQLVVTVDAQLFYGVLQALPYLVRYPYECVEQTLNRFLSSGIVSSVFAKFPATAKMAAEMSARKTQLERFDEPDANRKMSLEETPWLQLSQGGTAAEDDVLNMLNPSVVKEQRDDALAKLKKMQLGNGGFPWFQGGPPDEHMTLYILLSLTRALEFNVEIPKDLVVNAWSFVRSWLDEHLAEMMSHNSGWETITMINFAVSGYPSPDWTGGLFDEPFRKKLLDFSFKHWKEHSPLLKGYLALTLKRLNRAQDAKLVWDSVMDSAKHDDQLGTYWAREDRSWLWYNDEIDTHAFALRTQMELNQNDKHNEGMVQWLFLNKKLNHWKSTRATAEVIYALSHYLGKTSQLGVREAVKVELGSENREFQFDPDKYTGKKNQLVIAGDKIDGKVMSKVKVSKTTPGFAFASATWQFSTEKLPAEERGDFFQVSRKYFRREHSGKEWRLVPLSEGAKVAVGDQVEVQLSLRTKHAAEYVHLRDPRGAGFEPENVNSGYKWDLGISWYEETRDSGSNFFFSRLPVGEYTFKYRLRANMEGTFRVGPATVQSMYAPEFNAYSAGNVLRIE